MNGFTAAAAVTLRARKVVGLAGLLCCAIAPVPVHAASAPSAPAARNVIMGDLSCPSATRCMTVGNDISNLGHARPLAELWNGAKWTATHPREPAHATATRLFGVSCPTRSACIAVGDYDTNADPNGRPYAQTWNGRTWTITPVPEPPNDSFSSLGAVSCSTARSCVATGQVLAGGYNQTYTAVFNGHAWRLEWPRLPGATTYSYLGSVSCTGPRLCTASGEYQVHDSSKSRTLIETWNGRTWTRRATSNPRSGPNGSTLDAVSCATRRSCMAVGHRNKLSNDGSFTVAERFDGHRWTRSPARDLPGTATSTLRDVACPSRRRCVAVGVSFSQTPTQTTSPLSESWSGTSWRIDATPAPAGAIAMSLEAVACSAPNACVAVGDYYASDPYADDHAAVDPGGAHLRRGWMDRRGSSLTRRDDALRQLVRWF